MERVNPILHLNQRIGEFLPEPVHRFAEVVVYLDRFRRTNKDVRRGHKERRKQRLQSTDKCALVYPRLTGATAATGARGRRLAVDHVRVVGPSNLIELPVLLIDEATREHEIRQTNVHRRIEVRGNPLKHRVQVTDVVHEIGAPTNHLRDGGLLEEEVVECIHASAIGDTHIAGLGYPPVAERAARRLTCFHPIKEPDLERIENKRLPVAALDQPLFVLARLKDRTPDRREVFDAVTAAHLQLDLLLILDVDTRDPVRRHLPALQPEAEHLFRPFEELFLAEFEVAVALVARHRRNEREVDDSPVREFPVSIEARDTEFSHAPPMS